MAMLEVKNLGISFGGLRAVDGFEMQIEKGQLYGLIGPNGAGKTTVFNMLTGVYKPDDGSIVLDGKDITGKKTIDINKAGIARTFQNIRLFKDQSVLDNDPFVGLGMIHDFQCMKFQSVIRILKFITSGAVREPLVHLIVSAAESFDTLHAGIQIRILKIETGTENIISRSGIRCSTCRSCCSDNFQ